MIQTHNPTTRFLHIPKTAGTSIRLWLLENTHSEDVPPWHELHTKEQGITQWCVTRHPVERILDAYAWHQIATHKKLYDKHKLTPRNLLHNIKDFYNYNTQEGKWLQYKQLDYTRECDIILRMETLEKDFQQIQELFKCNKPLGNEKHIDGKHKEQLLENVTPSDIAWLEQELAQEIQLLGYDK